MLTDRIPITAEALRNAYLGLEAQEEEKTLLDLIDYHNERSREVLEWGTLKNYFTTRKYIEKFIRQKLKRNDIALSELNFRFLTDFEYFLRKYQPVDHRKPMGNNTVMKHIERLRKVINLGVDVEWLPKDPFIRFKSTLIKRIEVI